MAHGTRPAPPLDPTKPGSVGLGNSSATAPLLPGAAGGYGPALPVVYGTCLCPGRVVFLDYRSQPSTSTAGLRQVYDAWTCDANGTWTANGTSWVTTAIIAACQGPADLGNYIVRDNSRFNALGFLSHGTLGSVGAAWVRGDGTETVWSRMTLSAGSQELQIVQIPASGVYTVPDAGSWFADVSVKAPDVGVPGSASATYTPGAAYVKVSSGPTTGQFTVAAGVYTFNVADAGRQVLITFQRTVNVAGWGTSAIPLRRTAHVRMDDLQLPSETSVPAISFVVKGFLATMGPYGDQRDGTIVYEAHPADVLVDLLTNAARGLGLSTSQVEVDYGADGLTASSYRTYCTSMGFSVARAIDEAKPVRELVAELLLCTNAIATWSGGVLRVIPNGNVAVGTYQPPSVAYAIGADDLLPMGGDAIRATRVLPNDTYNCWPVSFSDRGSYYESVTVDTTITDPLAPAATRRAQVTDLPWVCRKDMAITLSRLMAQRSLFCRNTYQFQLGPRWALLEPGDLISLTEPVTGLDATVCRIRSIEEGESGELTLYAEEYPAGVAHTVQLVTQTADGMAYGLGSTAYDSAYGLLATGNGAGTNLLCNSDFSQGWPTAISAAAWNTWTVGGSSSSMNAALTFGVNLSSTWSLGGNADPKNTQSLNTFWLRELGTLDDQTQFADLSPAFVPVNQGRRYCASIYTASARCKTQILFNWYQADGVTPSAVQAWTSGAGIYDINTTTPGDAQKLDSFNRIFIVGTPPSDAAFARLVVRKFDTYAGQADSYLFTCRAQVEELGLYGAAPGPWVAGATKIDTYQGQNHLRYFSLATIVGVGGTSTTFVATFTVAEPDTSYGVVATPALPDSMTILTQSVSKSTTGFSVTVTFNTTTRTMHPYMDVVAVGLRNGG